MLKTYLFLVGAIICEVCGTMLLPVTQNFTKVTPTVFLAGFYLSAFYLLTFVVDKLPIAIVYGTWSGLGIFTIAILGLVNKKKWARSPRRDSSGGKCELQEDNEEEERRAI